MTAYWVFQVNVSDPEGYEEYKKRTPPILAKHGGKFLARGGRTVTLEGKSGRFERVVVIEFSSYDQALACYNSAEYQEAMTFRKNAAIAEVVLVEGI